MNLLGVSDLSPPFGGHDVATGPSGGFGGSILDLDGLWMPFTARAKDDRSAYPISVLGGILGRFKARPDLVAAIPGKLLPGVPPGPVAVPYATLVQVGDREQWVTRGQYRVVWTTFLLTVCGRHVAETSEAYSLLDAEFSPGAVISDPIPLRKGVIREARLSNPRLAPSAETDRGGNLVRRKVAYLLTTSVEWT